MTVRELRPETMNGTDAALWDIERDPSLRTTVVSIMQLDREVDPDALRHGLEAASRLNPRLRQHVVEAPLGLGPPSWVLDETFDVDDHLEFMEFTGPVVFGDVLAVATDFATTPFDRSQPLWQAAYVGGLAHGRAALVLKVHHSMTDGVGGVALLDALLDAEREAPLRDVDSLPEWRAASGEPTTVPLTDAVGRALSLPVAASRTALGAALHPLRSASRAVAGGRSAVRLLAPSGDPLSPLFGERGFHRRVAVHDIDLVRMHDAAARHHCTVNHLFFAGVIGGAVRHHIDRGMTPDGLRVNMPVNFRRSDDPSAGNQWAPVRFRVPTDIDDAVERMLAIRAITSRSRKEPALGFSHALAGVVQLLPSALSSGVVGGMMHGVDLTLTNVPGLSEPRYLAGAHVERLYAFAPTAGAAFNVALVSHEATACFGMMSDADAVPDPDGLHDAIVSGMEEAIGAAERAPATGPPPVAAPPSGPQRLSALDVSFLRIETPETPMHIGGVFVLEGAPLRDDEGTLRFRDIRRHVEARLARVPKFRRRLAEVPLQQGRPVWIDDPDFEIAHHVRFASVRPPGGRDELLELCVELDGDLLDRSRPLWELWFIDGLADGQLAILQKVHHALLDGVSSVEFTAALFGYEPRDEPDFPVRRPVTPTPSGLRLVSDAWVEHLQDPFELARRTGERLRATPGEVAAQARDVVNGVIDFFGPDSRAPRSSLNQSVGRRRQLVPVELPMADVEQVRQSLGGSVNDVALATLAGGLRSWFEQHHEPLEELHAMCPVSVRHPSDDDGGPPSGGNHVGGMLIPLPLLEPDPARRLAMIRERTKRAKQRHDGSGVASVLDAFDHLPEIAGPALRAFLANQPFVNLVITNVPGPSVPLWFLGAEVRSIVPIVPLGPNFALGVALLSYVDTLTIGLHADPDHCAELPLLADDIGAELEALVRLADARPS